MNDIELALAPVARVLDALSVPFRVGGSVASSALGVARTTLDVDIVADLAEEHAAALVSELGDAYYVDAEMIREAVRRREAFNIIHLATMMKIDVFVRRTRPFDRQAFERFIMEPLGDDESRRFPVSTAEDIILHKLEWFRLGGGASKRQWEDVLGVMRLQGDALDRAYLERWATELRVDDLLRSAFEDAGSSR